MCNIKLKFSNQKKPSVEPRFSMLLFVISIQVILTSAQYLAPGNLDLLTTSLSVTSSADSRTVTMTEAVVRSLQSDFWNMQKERLNLKFFTSCVSEGLVPNGMKIKFNLAKDVNNEAFVKDIEKNLNYQASRILDTVKDNTEEKLKDLEESFDKAKEEVFERYGDKVGKAKIIEAKRNVSWKIRIKEKTIKKKLKNLKMEKQNEKEIDVSEGSRKIKANNYIREEETGVLRGAPFPKNLRPSRRNRPKCNAPQQHCQITLEDLEKRNPVVVTEREVNLTDSHKSLCRKGQKFVPTPTKPVDNMEIYEDWLKWRNRMRWKYYHSKKRNFEGEDPDFIMMPWYQHSEHSPPAASASVEAFMETCLTDMMDPDQRRKIHDNLDPSERAALKDFEMNFPADNLRIRLEDKGPRFVIADGDQEDEMIENDLRNENQFTELPADPKEEYRNKLVNWTRKFEDEGVEKDVATFVIKDLEESHPARPKPLYKTHKLNADGSLKNPVPIRNVSTSCGTPSHNLSKICQVSIKHLTSEESLPRNNKSTNAALRRIIFINENFTPLNDDSILVFPDIVKMYPSTDVIEAVAKVENNHTANPNDYGFTTDCVVEALRICNECNCIQFNGKYYLPCKGVATGPAHACEMTDIWIGSITEKHLQTCPVETIHFSIYRDDGLDVLPGGEADLPALVQHFSTLHTNLDWEFKSGKDGAYLDLWVMLKDGKIETKIFTKSEPVYVGPSSCHDPKVFKSIFKGV